MDGSIRVSAKTVDDAITEALISIFYAVLRTFKRSENKTNLST